MTRPSTAPAVAAPALTRRAMLAGAGLFLAGCATNRVAEPETPARRALSRQEDSLAFYGPLPDERFPVPAVDLSVVEPRFLRQVVPFMGPERVGTVIVAPGEHHLYLVMEGGRAMRYGVGVGREGLEWNGSARVARKAEWPRWTPTAAMIAREPERNGPWAGGMAGGLENPLGARALYLYEGNRDTLYRLHGTNEDWSIGRSVSSGCIRLFNHDIIDLHRRVPINTPVIVRPA
jgi:lipoprotein-anchoring transpeptidase ErfK/SrfK